MHDDGQATGEGAECLVSEKLLNANAEALVSSVNTVGIMGTLGSLRTPSRPSLARLGELPQPIEQLNQP